MKLILVVCTGNICRSPMAAALVRQRLAAAGLADEVQVSSAGVFAREGQGAAPPAVAVMTQQGLSLDEHRSQPVTIPLLAQASLVLVMEETHRRSLFYFAPQHLGKVYLLTEMAGGHEDIADPYGGPAEGYAQAARRLAEVIDAGFPSILKRLGLTPSAADTSAA